MEDVDDILALLAFTDFGGTSRAARGAVRRQSSVRDVGNCLADPAAQFSRSLREVDPEYIKEAGLCIQSSGLGNPALATVSRNITLPGVEGGDQPLEEEDLFQGYAHVSFDLGAPHSGCSSVQSLSPLTSRRGTPLNNLRVITEPLDRVAAEMRLRQASDHVIYQDIQEALDHAASGSLAFDSFQLDTLSDHRPLSTLTMHLFKTRNVITDLYVDEKKLQSFVLSVEDLMADHPYHNRIHITDVLQALHAETLPDGGLATLCYRQPLHLLAVLLAAVVHDVDHPGVNNDFLKKSGHHLAEKYAHLEGAIAENHHLDTALRLLRQEENSFLEWLSSEQWELVWGIVREMVLNTDMKKHLPFLTEMKQVMEKDQAGSQDSADDYSDVELVKAAMQFSIAMKCADLGHTVRPPVLHIQWTKAVTTEFYQQGDREAREGLQVTQGMFRPDSEVEVYESQAWFLENHLEPLFSEWASFSPSKRGDRMLEGIRKNIEEWKSLSDSHQRKAEATGSPLAPTSLLQKIRNRRNTGGKSPSSPVYVSTSPFSNTSEDLSDYVNASPRFTSSMRSIPLDQYLDGLEPAASAPSVLPSQLEHSLPSPNPDFNRSGRGIKDNLLISLASRARSRSDHVIIPVNPKPLGRHRRNTIQPSRLQDGDSKLKPLKADEQRLSVP